MTVIESNRNNGPRPHATLIAFLTLFGSAALLPSSASVAAPAAAIPAVTPNAGASSATSQNPEVAKRVKDADAALRANNPGLALFHLRDALRLAPKDGRIRAELGITLLNTGDAATAERELRQAWADGSPYQIVIPPLLDAMLARGESKDLLDEFTQPTADILRARAVAYQDLGQAADANDAIERSLAIRRDAVGMLFRARIAARQGDLKLALSSINDSIRLDPHSAVAIRFKVAVLSRSGDNQQALNVANDLVRRAPASLLAKFSRIEVLIALNRDAEAKVAVDEVLKIKTNSLSGLYYRALLLVHAKDYKNAWHIAQSFPGEFVQSRPDVAFAVAQMAVSADNLESGGAILSALVAKYPHELQARLRLAALRLQQGSPDVALTALEPIKNADNPQVQSLFTEAYLKLNRYAEAIGALEKIIAIREGGPAGKPQPTTEWEAITPDSGIQSLRQIVDEDPSKAENVAPLVAVLSHTGKWDEALALTDRIAKVVNSKNALPPFLRGQILMMKNDPAGASMAFDQALARDPKYVPALYFRARLGLTRGDLARAANDLKAIIAEDPKNVASYIKLAETAPRSVEAQLLLAAAYSDNHDPNNAIATLKRAVALDPGSVQMRAPAGTPKQNVLQLLERAYGLGKSTP